MEGRVISTEKVTPHVKPKAHWRQRQFALLLHLVFAPLRWVADCHPA
jgi:hypothetical protein